jgi:hypothetical protein
MKTIICTVTALLLASLTIALIDGTAHAAQLDWTPDQIKIEARKAEASFDDKGKLKIRTGAEEAGSVTLRPRRTKSWDLSGFQAVELTLRNGGVTRIVPQVTLKSPLDDLPTWEYGDANSLYLDPGETRKLLIYFTSNEKITDKLYPWVKGMRAGPNTQLFLWKGVDSSAIESISFSALDVSGRKGFQQGEYLVEDIRPVKFHELFGYPAKTEFPFIDTYGQFKQGNWPGKLSSAAEFPARRKAETADLEANPRPKEWNKWGGWASGPKFPSTGYFHVRQVEGQWWFIDPDGCLFWSHGATGVGNTSAETIVSGRNNYFEPMPAEGDPLRKFVGKKSRDTTYDFYGANLFRKYGEDYLKLAEDLAHKRLASWGMNTYGNWSSGWEQLRTSFTVPVSYASPNLSEKLPDVWHPEFTAKLRGVLERLKDDGAASSPWNIGFFIHNEIKFQKPLNLARIIQGRPGDQPAKVAWVKRLAEKYGGIESLNKAWNTRYGSWDALLTSTEKVPYKNMAADADKCFEDYVDRFFCTSRDACKEFFPNHLYLGSRLHGEEDRMVMKAAEAYCDVISHNLYRKTLAGWTGPTKDLKRPVMATEFHFGALDRGMFHTGLQPASSQADRAEHYAEYVRSALRNSLFVGTHWFQYAPQSFTGRRDGENYQVGMLDIADTPSPELIRAVRKVGGEMYELRYRENDHTPQGILR